MRIKVAILDGDEKYLERIVRVLHTRYLEKLEIYAFTEAEQAFHVISEEKIYIFLSADQFEIDLSQLPSKCEFRYLVDTSDVETVKGYKTVCKYQKAGLIYKEILDIYAESQANIFGIRKGEDDAEIVAFLSPAGGVGTTTSAVSYALWLAERGKKVCYITLDPFQDTKLLLQSEGTFDFGDILYTIKSKRANLALKLESAVRRDKRGVYYYEATKTPLDLLSMKEDEWNYFLEQMIKSAQYEVLVLDLPFQIADQTHDILNRCSSVIMVSDGTEMANGKIVRAYDAWRLLGQQEELLFLDRVKLLYNKFSSTTGTADAIGEMECIGGLPKYKNALQSQILFSLSQIDIYSSILA